MKIVSPKKSSRRYMIFTMITLFILAFFLTSTYWTTLKIKSKSSKYDEIIKQNDYNIKITAASYHDGICEFTLKCKLMKDNSTQSYPKVSSIKFDADPNEYEFSSGEKYDEYSQIITIEKPPTEFEYVTILVTSELADIVHEDSYNDFGELVSGYTEKGKTFEDTIVIDKKDMANKHIKAQPGHMEDSEMDDDPAQSVQETTVQNAAVPAEIISTTQADRSPYAAENNTSSTSESSAEAPATITTTTPAQAPDNNNGGGNGGGGGGGGGNQPAYVPDYDPPETQQTHSETEPPTTTDPPQTTAQPTAPTTTRPPETTSPQAVHPNRIYIETDFENNNVVLEIGAETKLRAIVEPENAADKSVKWSCNRSGMIEIDSDGKVKAIAKGKVIVTAETSDGGLKASCMVTVK